MQSMRIIERMDEKLGQLPKVIEQAHKRIIGERQVKNDDKLLSAHEPDIDVIVRGKTAASVEFGNELLVGESTGGLIIDYMLHGKSAPSEAEKLKESVERQQELKVAAKPATVVIDQAKIRWQLWLGSFALCITAFSVIATGLTQ